ncbi:MAG: LamG domain-containing protein [Planctomycetota bacterium]
MTATPTPTGYVWGNVGTNDPEQLYVALGDGTQTVVIEHPDPCAATLTDWQEWNIELTDFTGLNLSNITKVHLGLGDRVTHPDPGGSGAIYVDDIRACPPRCVPAFAQMTGDIATPYDCTVDEKDIRVLAGDFLLRDRFTPSVVPGSPIAQYLFDGNFFDSMGLYHGTAMGNASIITDFDRGQVLSLDGDGDYVDLGNPTDPCALDFGTVNWTVSAWVKTTMSGTGDGDASKGVIYSKGGDQGGGHRYGLYVNENQGTQGRITLITDDNSNKVMVDGSVINDGEWHHVAGMRDGNDLHLYLDGLPNGTDNLPAGYDLSGTHQHNAYIGTVTAHGDDPNGTILYKYLRGSVDDVRIYGYALSEGEVAYLATDGGAGIHFPINSPADLYQKEPQGEQWINFRDYSILAEQYLEKVLWP